MTRIPSLLISLAALGAIGCEQAVDLEGLAPAQIVIDSQLRAGAGVRVDVRVIDSFGRPTDSEGLEETTGTVTGSDGSSGTLVVQRFTDSTATLTLDNVTVHEGLTYKLELHAPGFAPLRSITKVPPTVVLLDDLSSSIISGEPSAAIEVPISFDDPLEEINYYHLLVWIKDALELSPNDQFRAPTLSSLVTASRSQTSAQGMWYFNDANFRNHRYSGTLYLDREDLLLFTNPVAVLELRTVSQAYYDFFSTRLAKPGGGPQNKAEYQTDNVVGGSGIFGSYSASFIEVSLAR